MVLFGYVIYLPRARGEFEIGGNQQLSMMAGPRNNLAEHLALHSTIRNTSVEKKEGSSK